SEHGLNDGLQVLGWVRVLEERPGIGVDPGSARVLRDQVSEVGREDGVFEIALEDVAPGFGTGQYTHDRRTPGSFPWQAGVNNPANIVPRCDRRGGGSATRSFPVRYVLDNVPHPTLQHLANLLERRELHALGLAVV